MKKAFAALFALCLCLLGGLLFLRFSRPQGEEARITPAPEGPGEAREAVYAVTELDGPALQMADRLAPDGDGFVFAGSTLDGTHVLRCDQNGENIREMFQVPFAENVRDLYAWDGHIFLLSDHTVKADDGTGAQVNCLIEMDESGQELGRVTLGGEGWTEELTLPWRVLRAGDLILIADLGGTLVGLDAAAPDRPLFTRSTEGLAALARLPDGRAVTGESLAEGGYALRVLDEAGNGAEERLLTGDFEAVYTGGARYDLYLSDGSGLYGYDWAGGEPLRLLSWSACGLTKGGAVAETGESAFLTLARLNGQMPSPLARMDRTALRPGDAAPLVLATMDGEGAALRYEELILAWNRAHPEQPVEIRDYGAYRTGDDSLTAQTRLLTDLASGSGPDMFDFSYGFSGGAEEAEPFSVGMLARRGLLEDISPYLDADEDLDRSDLLEGLREALAFDGKLYEVVMRLPLLTSCGAGAELGDDPAAWTYEGLGRTLERTPRAETLFVNDRSREEWLDTLVSGSGDKLVDWERGQCFFDSDYFVHILETVKAQGEAPALEDWRSVWQPEENKGLLVLYGDDTLSLMSPFWTYGPGGYRLVGLPEVGNVAVPTVSCGISALSEHKRACWDFLKGMYTSSFALGASLYEPAVRENLEFRLSEYSEDWDIDYESFSGYLEELDRAFAEAATVYRHDEQIWRIVRAEAEPYFAGQRTAEETAKNIQSRVSLYMAEQG